MEFPPLQIEANSIFDALIEEGFTKGEAYWVCIWNKIFRDDPEEVPLMKIRKKVSVKNEDENKK